MSQLNSNTDDKITPKPVAILGIGGAGAKIISALLKLQNPKTKKIAVIDFDERSLSQFPKELQITADNFSSTHRFGTGGDFLIGERYASICRAKIAKFIDSSEYLIAVCAMGGGSGTPTAPIVARIAKNAKIPSIFVLAMPFSFEGHKKMQDAERGLETIMPDADVVIPIHNDLLYSILPSDTPVEEAFKRADMAFANVVNSLSDFVRGDSYLCGTFPSFKNLLGKKKSSCSIGFAEVKCSYEEDICKIAVDKLLESPLLGGINELKSSHASVVMLQSGKDLSMGMMKKTLEYVKNLFHPSCEIICSASFDNHLEKTLRLSTLCIKYEKKLIEPGNPKKTSREETGSTVFTQDELPLITYSKGIFSNSSDNIINNQDLDVPTFIRKNVIIDKGK